jgi:hypothetical protein
MECHIKEGKPGRNNHEKEGNNHDAALRLAGCQPGIAFTATGSAEVRWTVSSLVVAGFCAFLLTPNAIFGVKHRVSWSALVVDRADPWPALITLRRVGRSTQSGPPASWTADRPGEPLASTTTYIQWLHIAYLRGLAISNRRPPFFHCRLFQLHLGEGAPMHGDSSRCLPVLIARHVLTACRLLTTTDIENTWNIWSTTQMFSLFFSSSGHSRRIVLAVLHALPYHFLCREMQPPPHIYIDEMSELIMFGATTTRITLCVPFTIA